VDPSWRAGTPTSRLYWTIYLAYHRRGQARYPFRPLGVIRRDQARRVRATVAHAYRYVPYYRETMDRLDLRPSDFESAEDLKKLPAIERRQLQSNPEHFVSAFRPLDRYFPLRSSGSTGEPSTVYYDAGALFQNAAHGERERSVISPLLGGGSSPRETVIGVHDSSTRAVSQFLQKRTLFRRGGRSRRQFLSLLDPTATNVHLMNEHRPDLVHSYGSYLGILFLYLHQTGTPFHRPRVVTYTADSLSHSARHLIETEFNIPVFSSYQTTEAPRVGFECQQHRGFHVNADLYPVRILDSEEQEVPEGDSGELVVSNLINRGTVLLNYRLNDVGAMLPNGCPCNRSLPLLSLLEGRAHDLIELPSGDIVHPLALRLVFIVDEEDVWEFQIIQETRTYFRVAVVAAEDCNREHLRGRLSGKMARILGDEVTIDIDFVDSIERTMGGKLQTVISKCTRNSTF
jgi:phenylacetate-CoA ligase